jgi:hypothetical protein
MKFLTVQLPPFSCHLIPLRSKYYTVIYYQQKTSKKSVLSHNRLHQLLKPVLSYMEVHVSILSTVFLAQENPAECYFFTNSKTADEWGTEIPGHLRWNLLLREM